MFRVCLRSVIGRICCISRWVVVYRDDWNVLVAPRVECNIYRKRISPIPKIEALSTRATVMGRALARVEKDPSLVWMVLSQNHDAICSFLLNEAVTSQFRIRREKMEKNPSLVWMVLSQNDVICSFLVNEARDVSVSDPSRKRTHSSSADTRIAH
jgi:hypothetical protein